MADLHATCTPIGIGDLARRLDVHSSTVRRWLAGHLLPEPRGPERPGRWDRRRPPDLVLAARHRTLAQVRHRAETVAAKDLDRVDGIPGRQAKDRPTVPRQSKGPPEMTLQAGPTDPLLRPLLVCGVPRLTLILVILKVFLVLAVTIPSAASHERHSGHARENGSRQSISHEPSGAGGQGDDQGDRGHQAKKR
jgi:hypothetical protein